MKLLRSVGEGRRGRLRAAEVMGREEQPTPAFSAKQLLESHVARLKGDLTITRLDQGSEAALHSKLAFLVSEQEEAITGKLSVPYPQTEQQVYGNGESLYLQAQRFPESIVLMRRTFPQDRLVEDHTKSLEHGMRPQVWRLLLGRVLYPEAEVFALTEADKRAHLAKIQEWLKGDPSEDDKTKALRNAAQLVLLEPSLRGTFQPLCSEMKQKFEEKLPQVFENTCELVDMAFDLEIIYGETFDGLDELGHIRRKRPVLEKGKPLPERLIA